MKWFGFRLGVVAKSLIAFFFLSTITALVVRVLISSGVIFAFVLWYALTARDSGATLLCGNAQSDDRRVSFEKE